MVKKIMTLDCFQTGLLIFDLFFFVTALQSTHLVLDAPFLDNQSTFLYSSIILPINTDKLKTHGILGPENSRTGINLG